MGNFQNSHTLSLSDLKEIESDLEIFLDDPVTYTEGFRGLTQTYELDWKDVILLLNQILTINKRQTAAQTAIAFGNEYCIVNFRRPEDRQPEEPPIPTGAQTIPV